MTDKAKEVKILTVEVKAIERTAMKGENKGNKFLSFKIFNTQSGFYEDVRFNKKVQNKPTSEGTFLLEVPRNEINRQGTERRKYPVTWISEIISVSEYDSGVVEDSQDDLPF